MTHLKASIGDVPNLVIISYRHISIAKAVARIFPNAFHALYIYHIRNNLVDKFKNKDIIPHFYLVAKVYRMSEFQMYWAKLHQYSGVTAYLEEVGLQQWARVYQVYCKYDKITTNIGEYLNGVLKDARELPLTKLLEHIREWLQGWFYIRHTHAMICTNIVTDYAMSIFKESKLISRTYRVSPVDMHIINVDDEYFGGLVGLRSRTCTCMEFNCLEIPCSHAISAATLRNINVQTLCEKWFTFECVLAAYTESIFPVGHSQEWVGDFEPILPPEKVVSVSRCQTIRIPSIGEEPQQIHKYTRCGQTGHNKKTCRQTLITPDTGPTRLNNM
ncbi:uncharacterized protein LOC120067378 [Benincasa hispida]|uniref:uncharacterized protein LOC120067378 n=1 Tax=Benincasa hispida TaxID=102211 RepID=UPI0019002CCB|nr:uncharacterized protein LOC120067378 [Benincasa hispida]